VRFEALFQRFYPDVFGLVYRVLGDPMETEDTLQESFVKLAAAGDLLDRPDAEVGAWLRRVALNAAFNRRRDDRRARERIERAGRMDVPGTRLELGNPPVLVARLEEQAGVRDALAKLPDRQRECLLMRHSGYSYAEIAATIGVAIGSVGTLLARAEEAFRVMYLEVES
jgi:RNA polymerase sigma factor (sigma-70 family)